MATGDIDMSGMVDSLNKASDALQVEIDRVGNSSTMNSGDMLQLQMLMNKFSQFNEMCTSLIGVTNDTIKKMLQKMT